MSKELEERIEKKKKMIADFRKVAKSLGYPDTYIEEKTDMFLNELSKLMKERD